MRNYKAEEYINLVENIKLDDFNHYMSEEVSFINSIRQSEQKTFIELGAGYGRIIPHIINNIKEYIGIEINPKMFDELKNREHFNDNVFAIKGDMINLNQLLKSNKQDEYVLMLLQNTLGSLECNLNEIIDALKIFFKQNKGILIISVLKSDKLKTFGLEFYKQIKPICGSYDPIKSDLNNGVFVTNTNYKSKWWKKDELIELVEYLKPSNYQIKETKNAFFLKANFSFA